MSKTQSITLVAAETEAGLTMPEAFWAAARSAGSATTYKVELHPASAFLFDIPPLFGIQNTP